MNNVENSNIPRYGVLLTDNVDPQWLVAIYSSMTFMLNMNQG